MSEVTFNVRQNLVVLDSIAEGVLSIHAEHRDGTTSNVFNYVMPEVIDSIGTEALIRGFKDVLKTAFNGIADSAAAIAKANKAIELMTAGKMSSRSTNGGSNTSKELPYLVQAVLKLYPDLTVEAWYALTQEERNAMRTPEVNKIAGALETIAKQAEAAKVLEGIV
jgi:hypothetical protein